MIIITIIVIKKMRKHRLLFWNLGTPMLLEMASDNTLSSAQALLLNAPFYSHCYNCKLLISIL